MKTIPLTQDYVALVDDADYESVSAFKWRALVDKRSGKVYAVRKARGSHNTRKSLYLHRELLGVTDPSIEVDHSNGNSLDNQRENLCACTTSQKQHECEQAQRRVVRAGTKVSAGTSGTEGFRQTSSSMENRSFWKCSTLN
jgi:hypothetical protein